MKKRLLQVIHVTTQVVYLSASRGALSISCGDATCSSASDREHDVPGDRGAVRALEALELHLNRGGWGLDML